MEHEPFEKNISLTQQRSGRILVIAILIAGVMISGAIYFAGKSEKPNAAQQTTPSFGGESLENIKPVGSADHIRGNPNAPIKIVEFSDPECPFCKRFHITMQQIMREYGASGQVAWIYRQFPIDQIHSLARKETEATECAGGIGGNDTFWEYLDRLLEITPSNNNLDPQELLRIADYVRIDRGQFEECLQRGNYAQHIQDDVDDAIRSGGTGTPYSIVIAKNGKKFVINGAQPYSVVKAILDVALQEK
ncbi:MAG: DsbA family protein [Candidatus Azambacteria bacterium]|nr:DsbA family protein [Candidatus Azambacteria bacterium]